MKKDFMVDRLIPVLVLLAVIFSIFSVVLLQQRKVQWADAQEIVQEKLRPANLQVVKITLANCDFCYDLSQAVDALKKQNVNITLEEDVSSDSAVAKELISRYGLIKLPTMIVSGELNKSEQLSGYFNANGELRNERFIFTALKAPYYDLEQDIIVGKVNLYQLKDSTCSQCPDLSKAVETLQKSGVFLTSNKQVEYNSEEGKKLIAQFGVDNVPALLISDDIDYYEPVKQQLEKVEAAKKDGFYAVHSLIPPYRDLAKNKVVGLVELITLTDTSCQVCYDVSVNKQILQRLGLLIASEKTVDISSAEGQQLKQKYQITKVPIILASPDAAVYDIFTKAWDSVGSVEADGWYVMRKPELLGVYKDLLTNTPVGEKAAVAAVPAGQ